MSNLKVQLIINKERSRIDDGRYFVINESLSDSQTMSITSSLNNSNEKIV
jgi:hypothetical protein